MCSDIITKAINPIRNCLVSLFTNYISAKIDMHSLIETYSIFTRKFSPSKVNSLIHSTECPSYEGFALDISKYKF